MKNILLVALGIVSLILGGIGLMLPIFPTTPFVLISAVCFSGSSPRLYKKLQGTKYFGEFVENYKNKTWVSKSTKVKSIVFLWMTLFISMIIFEDILVFFILLLVGILVTAHIITLRGK